jgi:hypothetical protein
MSYDIYPTNAEHNPNLVLQTAKLMIDSDLVHHVIVSGETGEELLVTKDSVSKFGNAAHSELALLGGWAVPTSPDETQVSSDKGKEIK